MHTNVGGRGVHHVSFADAGSVPIPGQQSPISSSTSSSPARPDLQATIIEPPRTPVVTVPLSSVPAEVLDGSPAKQTAHGHLRNSSRGSTTTAASTKTGRLSQLIESEKAKAEDFKLHMNRPRQVTGRGTKYSTALAWAGRIGWVGKAVVYAMIGGLAIQAAVSNSTPDPSLPQTEQVAASPQVRCNVVLCHVPTAHSSTLCQERSTGLVYMLRASRTSRR